MPVTAAVLKAMLEAYGGIPMSDEELEAAVSTVDGYLAQAEAAEDANTAAVYSGRVIHLEHESQSPG